MKEACGVFGIYAPGEHVSRLTFDGIFALQHRGQESAGIAVSDGEMITVVKDMGLVASVFDEGTLTSLTGDLAIGHTRYSTTGSSTWHNAQPVYRANGVAGFALGHNGNLTNTEALVSSAGILPGILSSDSDVIAELLAIKSTELGDGQSDGDLVEVLKDVLPKLEGAFSLVLMEVDRVIGVRDPNGFRPLCLGRLENGWVLASETPALDIVGATFEREIEPGEMVVIDRTGVKIHYPFPESRRDAKLCIFEFVYFARPDSILHGTEVHGARRRMGELLAKQAPAEADLVMGVPDSGVPAAEGFAKESRIPFGHGLVKNRYIGRTFMDPSPEARVKAVKRKLNPLRESIEGQRLVVVDDSIVRGTTLGALVQVLREAGAKEIHLRISSPPFEWPCFYGIDTPTRDELIAANYSVEEIEEKLGVDSLAYLSLENLRSAVGGRDRELCDACLTGNYPVPVKLETKLQA